ncbi:ATP-dependent RecD-like DNA helicase [Mesonia ostreae]|uniref:AAA family ATPase n=1 Tax=Mesonia ostreae TaxID=861110 RepID=A0ABU2KKI7_9FLAO|nr:AAA family ATPase [Mesonia ostreae]MDT0295164.1 AAA family ATPase [Mesonia ostreae]
MTSQELYRLLIKEFSYQPTVHQDIALQKLSIFLTEEEQDHLFILKGYAGTGKTTIIGTIVKNLWKIKKSPVLIAPTGRAAKVMSNYSGNQAFTIHKKIYFPKKSSGGGSIEFTLQPNKHKNTIFIVDEASMISDSTADKKLFTDGSLLDDLIQYVYSGKNCKLIFIGDTAQLPPVHHSLSPALDPEKLSLSYDKKVDQIELTEVMRQQLESGILENATLLRDTIKGSFYDTFKFKNTGGDFIRLIDGYEIMDAINDAYSSQGHEETAIVVMSNKRANIYNEQIRSRILFRESEIAAGDFLMVVKNNYFWIKSSSEASFIANGDIVEILEIFEIVELYGFRFAEVKVQMVDYPKMKPFETVVMLDTLTSNTPSLPYEESNKLYQEVMKDYADETSKYKKFLKVKSNKYFNALQIKFSYAMTCHKSQGGQWNTVFVEQPYLKDGITEDYLRWLYTACTRAKEKLYLIGFKDDFFEDDSEIL